jgi:hypothetical protein
MPGVQEWLNSPNVGIAAPTVWHWEILRAILPAGQAKGRLVTDAHLARWPSGTARSYTPTITISLACPA